MSETISADTSDALLASALHLHLQAVAKRPIDAAMLLELEHTCLLARQLLAVGKQPDAFSRRNLVHPNLNVMPNYVGFDGGMAMPAPSNPTETFGVQAIKELIALIPELIKQANGASSSPEPTPALGGATVAATAEQQPEVS
jgi:hypothetical protein